MDDYGFAEAGWHRNTTIGGVHIPYTDEVVTPGQFNYAVLSQFFNIVVAAHDRGPIRPCYI